MVANDSLGVGLYALADAARLLKTNRKTLAGWVNGYVRQSSAGERRYEPVLGADRAELTFGDLVELLYVREFRKVHVPLENIRSTAQKFRNKWETRYPFATRKFAVEGQQLLLDEGGVWRQAVSGQHVALMGELGAQFVHIGDLAGEWRPLGKDRAVVLDPGRSFGKPIEAKSGAHTYVLAQALKAGDTARQVAWWYDTSEGGVLDAAEFEASLVT